MKFNEFKVSKASSDNREMIRVNPSQRRVRVSLGIFSFVDKDTKQHVLYIPAIELSAYGETKEKAMDMLKESVAEFSIYLLNLPTKSLDKELASHGFKREKFSSKNFSRAFVDVNGELQNLNAEDEKVERLTLVA